MVFVWVCQIAVTNCTGFIHGSACDGIYTSNTDNEFYLAFMSLWAKSGDYHYDFKLFISSSSQGDVNIAAPAIGYNRTFHLNGTTLEITLSRDIGQFDVGVSNKGVLITSTTSIAVHCLRAEGDGLADGFTALGTSSLSTTYVIASYQPDPDNSYANEHARSQFTVIAVSDRTNLVITINTTGSVQYEQNAFQSGESISVNLNRLQTFHLSHINDLSGTIVTADKPVAVFSGGTSKIPNSDAYIDYYVSQLLPAQVWDTMFIVPNLSGAAHYLIRAFSLYNDATIRVTEGLRTEIHQADMNNFFEKHYQRPVVVSSSAPVSLVQYSYGKDTDAMMLSIPGVHQYMTSYTLTTKTKTRLSPYTSVIIQNASLPGLLLDNRPFQPDTVVSVPYPKNKYVIATKQLKMSAEYRLTHQTKDEFGVIVYDVRDSTTTGYGYGYSAGFKMQRTDCTTTPPPITHTTSTPTTQQTTNVTPGQTTDTVNLKNLRACFSCDAMTSLKYCETFEICNKTEICFVERYLHGHHMRYRSGCISSTACRPRVDNSGTCMECCSSGFCNSQGCDDNGFGIRQNRGPVCLDCSHLGNPLNCDRVELCPYHEVCSIQEFRWGGNDKRYTMGCQPRTIAVTNCTGFIHGSACDGIYTNNTDKEFYLAFMSLWAKSGYAHYDFKLFISSSSQGDVSIVAPAIGYNRTFHLNGTTLEITLSRDIGQFDVGVSNKGVLITSMTSIAVHCLRAEGNGLADGFTALGTSSLSTAYVIASYQPGSSGSYTNMHPRSQFTVIAVSDRTNLVIAINTTGSVQYEQNVFKSGESISVNLNRLQTFHLSHINDLSGTIVTADKHIAVFSGGTSSIPIRDGQIDYYVSQLLPAQVWDTMFIVPNLSGAAHYLIRAFSLYNDATIRVTEGLRTEIHRADMNNFFEKHYQRPVVVSSSAPVSLVQYSYGQGTDSMMLSIPGVHQYMTSYTLTTKTKTPLSPYTSVIIQNVSLPGLLLDNRPFQPDTVVSVPYPKNKYVIVTKQLSMSAEYRLTHQTKEEFGVIVYDVKDTVGYGYGYSAGFKMQKTDCTTPPPITHTTPTLTTQQTTNVTPGQTTDTVDLKNLRACFSCDAMTSLKYCETFEICNKTEVCFVERYLHGHHLRYRSGCISSMVCRPRVDNSGKCMECCSSGFCNSQGCDDNGFGIRQNRGPVCLDCSHLGNPLNCDRVELCPYHEVCSIQEFRWGENEKRYTMGCQPRTHCASVSLVGKRSVLTDRQLFTQSRATETCSSCCDEDYCNLNCTAKSLGPNLIG